MSDMFEFIETKPGGWLHIEEDRARLLSHSQFLLRGWQALPEEVDPSSWVRVENQGDQGSCQGHSLSSCVEHLHRAAGHEYLQLSRAQAYYQSQRISSIRGDRGSTVEAGCRLAMTDGICLEEVWPYPGRYDPSIPSGYASSKRWKIEGHEPVRNLQTMMDATAFDVVHSGFMWSGDIDRQVARDGIVRNYSGGGGGHSVMWKGYRRTDWSGRELPVPYLLMKNSWDVRWGHNGWCLWSPEAFDQVLRAKWSVFERLYGCVCSEEAEPPLY